MRVKLAQLSACQAESLSYAGGKTFLFGFLRCFLMLPAQAANAADAAMGPTPLVSDFFVGIDACHAQGQEEQPENRILGKSFAALANAEKAPGMVARQKKHTLQQRISEKLWKSMGKTSIIWIHFSGLLASERCIPASCSRMNRLLRRRSKMCLNCV